MFRPVVCGFALVRCSEERPLNGRGRVHRLRPALSDRELPAGGDVRWHQPPQRGL